MASQSIPAHTPCKCCALTSEHKHTTRTQVIWLEKALHFFWEQRIQHFFLQWPDFVRFWNVYYWVAHGSNTIGALLALFFIRPAIYQVNSMGLQSCALQQHHWQAARTLLRPACHCARLQSCGCICKTITCPSTHRPCCMQSQCRRCLGATSRPWVAWHSNARAAVHVVAGH